MLFSLDFATNTILSCFLFFLLIISLYFLIHTVIPKTFNPAAEFVILIGIPNKEAKAEMETNTVTVETAICKCSI